MLVHSEACSISSV